jgi:hypothetical protein
MAEPRILLLFDPKATPQTWNERMSPGEYAVLYSNLQPPLAGQQADSFSSTDPICVVFDSLGAAEEYATRQAAQFPKLRCRIYDHHGLGRSPVREIAGTEGAEKNQISARFRVWVGGGLLLTGIALGLAEWLSDFRLTWAGTVAARMAPVGVILLITELAIVLEARRKKRRERRPQA